MISNWEYKGRKYSERNGTRKLDKNVHCDWMQGPPSQTIHHKQTFPTTGCFFFTLLSFFEERIWGKMDQAQKYSVGSKE